MAAMSEKVAQHPGISQLPSSPGGGGCFSPCPPQQAPPASPGSVSVLRQRGTAPWRPGCVGTLFPALRSGLAWTSSPAGGDYNDNAREEEVHLTAQALQGETEPAGVRPPGPPTSVYPLCSRLWPMSRALLHSQNQTRLLGL